MLLPIQRRKQWLWCWIQEFFRRPTDPTSSQQRTRSCPTSTATQPPICGYKLPTGAIPSVLPAPRKQLRKPGLALSATWNLPFTCQRITCQKNTSEEETQLLRADSPVYELKKSNDIYYGFAYLSMDRYWNDFWSKNHSAPIWVCFTAFLPNIVLLSN